MRYISKMVSRAFTVRMIGFIASVVFMLPLAGQAQSVDTTSAGAAPASDTARAYLGEALAIMQEHALMRDSVDWVSVREQAMARAEGASTPAETYNAIRFAIAQLGDGHSFFLPPPEDRDERSAQEMTPETRRRLALTGTLLTGGVGYVKVPACCTISPRAFADSLQGIIDEQYEDQTCGWVVDLRGNTGGNMWPMLAGIGPILRADTVGTFVRAGGEQDHWFYRDGTTGVAPHTIMKVSDPVEVSGPVRPVAVLTDSLTMSSGEAIVVAFAGRTHTRRFGMPTGGKSTANKGYPLSDGAIILLTTSVFADRTGRTYGGPIRPDHRISSTEAKRRAQEADSLHMIDASRLQRQPVMEAATSWLREHEQCQVAPREE